MRSQPKVRSVQVTADTPLVTTAETVIATLNGVSNQSPDGIIRITGYASVLAGASTTGITLRIRRASLTGTLIGEADLDTLAAAATGAVPIYAEDAPGEVGGVAYVLTVQQTAATGNGTAQFASLLAIT